MYSRIFLLLFVATIVFSAPHVPVWPEQYTASLIFSTPYFKVNVPVDVVVDKTAMREYTSYYNGMDTYISFYDKGYLYYIGPQMYELKCQSSIAPGEGRFSALPSMEGWEFHGVSESGNNMWRMINIVNNYNNSYLFEVTNDGIPVRLEVHGVSILVFSSHPDHYVITYTSFARGINNQSVFDIPPLCTDAIDNSLYYRSRALERYFFAAINPVNFGNIIEDENYTDSKFLDFMNYYKKSYSSLSEMIHRSATFAKNLKFIEDHNARDDVTYKLAINKFADMEIEEIRSLITPMKFSNRPKSNVPNSNFRYINVDENLPPNVDWVSKGIVNPPKDQGACGSCWAFSSTGLFESVYAMKFGKLLSYSEQQIMDCSWDSGDSMSCDGGFPSDGLTWINHHGSLALENDYPYLMVDGFCRDQINGPGVNLTIIDVGSTVEAVSSALSRLGPLSISINAGLNDFYFLGRGGIYSNPSCFGSDRYLNHAVLLVGYGNEIYNGVNTPYWLIKNSWGEEWGDMGYVKILRDENNICGVLTEVIGLDISRSN